MFHSTITNVFTLLIASCFLSTVAGEACDPSMGVVRPTLPLEAIRFPLTGVVVDRDAALLATCAWEVAARTLYRLFVIRARVQTTRACPVLAEGLVVRGSRLEVEGRMVW